MSPKPVSPIAQAWYKWKALRLPWRKRFLIGLDLNGNTYWEFKDLRGTEGRWRRIVQYPSSTHHGDVEVSPAWHQWLRQTRKDPPSLTEQRQDLIRQERMKVLAAQADAKWEAKPRLMDMPAQATSPGQILGGGGFAQSSSEQQQPAPEPASEAFEGDLAPGSRQGTWQKMQQEPKLGGTDPWKQAQRRGGPGEEWQPQGWNPSSASRKS